MANAEEYESFSKKYFEWMTRLTLKPHHHNRYVKVLQFLNDVPFTYIFEMDRNRAADGVSLRRRFILENPEFGSVDILRERPCSVLEMMLGLSWRIVENITYDEELDNQIPSMFWQMMESLGLSRMDDKAFDEYKASDIIDRFLWRGYSHDGRGGLFTVEGIDEDMTQLEIWRQAMIFINRILFKRKRI